MNILLFGGSGTLGTALRKLDSDIIAPSSHECDITDFKNLYSFILDHKPILVINVAAVIDNVVIENALIRSIGVNISGSSHIAMCCVYLGIRYVYISTDYVYKGDKGNYKETDPVYPFNKYAWSKLGGECSAMMLDNSLVIRTSFSKPEFEHKQSFTDKWTSKDYVDVIAPMILEVAKSDLTGIINIGTERKTVYEHAIKRSNVQGVKIEDTEYNTPKDTSLNLDRWNEFKSKQ